MDWLGPSTVETWITHAARKGVEAPLAWAIAAAAIATVFAVIVMIVSYEPLNRASKDDPIQSELPAARYDTIKALIAATGQDCARICAVTSPAGATVDVACAVANRPNDCALPVHYRIAVAPSERP